MNFGTFGFPQKIISSQSTQTTKNGVISLISNDSFTIGDVVTSDVGVIKKPIYN